MTPPLGLENGGRRSAWRRRRCIASLIGVTACASPAPRSGAPTVVVPTAQPDSTPSGPPSCSGASLDLDVLLRTPDLCPGPAGKPEMTSASPLQMTADVDHLTAKFAREGSFVVTLVNTSDEPITLNAAAWCEGPARPRVMILGAPPMSILLGPCVQPDAGKTIRIVLAPHGKARHTVHFFPGMMPSATACCMGEAGPSLAYPPGTTYQLHYAPPFWTDGPDAGRRIILPLTIVP